MKIIFLDIDGVLNHFDWYASTEFQSIKTKEDVELDIDPRCTHRIMDLCNQFNAKVVITSSWKISWYSTIMRLERGGLPHDYVIDHTPDYLWIPVENFDKSRGAEIQGWLNNHPEVTNYVIVDDRVDFKEEQMSHFVQIDQTLGLTDENVEEIKRILEK